MDVQFRISSVVSNAGTFCLLFYEVFPLLYSKEILNDTAIMYIF